MPLQRRALLLAAALAALPRPGSAGCGSSEYAPGQTVNLRLESGGWNREFQMHVPAGYDEDAPTPVVLYFHGWGGSGSVSWYRAQADASTFLAGRSVFTASALMISELSGPPPSSIWQHGSSQSSATYKCDGSAAADTIPNK